MEIGETQEEEGKQPIVSVKGALSRLYKERNFGEKTELMRKTQMPFSDEKPPSNTRELHFLKKDIVQFNKNKKTADSLRAKAELELVNAKKTVKDLTAQIEKSNLNARATKNEVQMLRKSKRHMEKSTLDVVGYEKYDEVMKELETVKQELSKLKLNMACVLETKLQAEREIEASVSKVSSCSSSIEKLNDEIEKANEEQVLVELARIEAVKEFASIKAQREVEATQFSANMERIKKRIHHITRELKRADKLEAELAVTTSDVGVLQNELMLVKAMEMRSVVVNKSEEESETSSLLKSVNDELKGKKKELESIRREAYQCMASMDIIREEIKRVSKETYRSKKVVSKADSTVAYLNSKLVRANSKLEAVSSAEKKARAIVANLSAPLEHLRSEADEAKKEKEMISEELVSIIEEKKKYEWETDIREGKLKAVMEELEAVKASEARALENLRIVAENTVRSRESKSKHTSSIRISKFEHEYLSGGAKEAVEIADKKVLAAKAWVEAIKVEEKEIVLMTGMSNRELLRLMKEEEEGKNMTKKAIDQSEIDDERQEKEIDMEDSKLQAEVDLPIKSSVKESGNSTPARQAKGTNNARRPSSPGGRHSIQSGSILLRKRRKAMPNLSKLFHSSKIDISQLDTKL